MSRQRYFYIMCFFLFILHMMKQKRTFFIVDDDIDDQDLFIEAVNEVDDSIECMSASNCEEALDLLKNKKIGMPDMIFLDLNMPRKSGFECLTEIKLIDKLKDLPVIIFSTSLDMSIVDILFERGAFFYIQKPGDFSKLKKVILDALTITRNMVNQPTRDNFILQP